MRGQLSAFGDRFQISIETALAEPERYRHLIGDPFAGGAWLLVIGVAPALAFIAYRSRQPHAEADRLLFLSALVFAAGLAVADRTKAPLYAIVLLPSVCISLAAASVAALTWAWRSGQLALRLGSIAAGVVISASLAAEGVRAYQAELTAADEVTPYLAYGQRIAAFIEPGAAVLGPERWWWALHDHPYTSLRSVWFQWASRADETGSEPNFADWVNHSGAEQMIVNVNVRADIRAFPRRSSSSSGALWTTAPRRSPTSMTRTTE